MGRAERRRRRRQMPAGPLRHKGEADQLAGARWARHDEQSLTFYTMPWPVWLSAGFLVLIGLWVGWSAWLERNLFGAAGVMFFAFAYWIAARAPRERTSLVRDPGALRIEEGLVWIRPRRVLPFDEIDGFAVEWNRPRNLFRVVAVSGDERVPVGRSFVTSLEAGQRIAAIADWLAPDEPPVDRRLVEEDDEGD